MNRNDINNGAGRTGAGEPHVVKRFLAALLCATACAGAFANVAPTVDMTGPAVNAVFIGPATVTLAAEAADSDGTIAEVAFYRGTTLLATVTSAPYTWNWTNVAAGTYSITARATDNAAAETTSAPLAVKVDVNALPTVSLTAPAVGGNHVAPANIGFSATAADSDGTIAKVEFYNGTTLLATLTQAPYSYVWSGVATGSYEITAQATDDLGAVSTPAARTVTVSAPVAQAEVFYIYSDQINTARVIINAAGVKVWEADAEPFGANLPNESPAGQGQFTYNPRFPGQYFDRETGLHYNYYRDYDPQTGRYVQSDPIGLEGGINTYGYVEGNPLSRIDPYGLQTFIPTPIGPLPIPIPAIAPLNPVPMRAIHPADDILRANGILALKLFGPTIDAIANICGPSKQECDAQWAEARQTCRNLIYEQMQQRAGRRKKRSVVGVTGGFTDVETCASGLVSQECGGNNVDYGK